MSIVLKKKASKTTVSTEKKAVSCLFCRVLLFTEIHATRDELCKCDMLNCTVMLCRNLDL